jgi:hypothetical protein
VITRDPIPGIAPQYRQGDFFLIAESIPEDAELQPLQARYALEQGSSTGNTHALVGKARVHVVGSCRFLSVEEADMQHEEHKPPIGLPAGSYRARKQRTWSVLEQMSKQVID